MNDKLLTKQRAMQKWLVKFGNIVLFVLIWILVPLIAAFCLTFSLLGGWSEVPVLANRHPWFQNSALGGRKGMVCFWGQEATGTEVGKIASADGGENVSL